MKSAAAVRERVGACWAAACWAYGLAFLSNESNEHRPDAKACCNVCVWLLLSVSVLTSPWQTYMRWKDMCSF
eukprot:scaffold418415_cov29-Prasinocladus_malaysianus.AAC.1